MTEKIKKFKISWNLTTKNPLIEYQSLICLKVSMWLEFLCTLQALPDFSVLSGSLLTRDLWLYTSSLLVQYILHTSVILQLKFENRNTRNVCVDDRRRHTAATS